MQTREELVKCLTCAYLFLDISLSTYRNFFNLTMPWANTLSGKGNAQDCESLHHESLFFKVPQFHFGLVINSTEIASGFHSHLMKLVLWGVWEETLPIRFSLVSNRFLVSCADDLKPDPTVYTLLNNFPPWLNSLFSLSLFKHYLSSLCISYSHSIVQFLIPLSHLGVLSFPSVWLCLSIPLSPHLSLQPGEAQRVFVFPGGCRGNLVTGKAVII